MSTTPEVAIICDSTADLPPNEHRVLGIEMASLQVRFGDELLRDQVDIDTSTFYRRLIDDGEWPQTSEPPAKEFTDALGRVAADRHVLVMCLSDKLSKTREAAAAALAPASSPTRRVEVLSTNTVTLAHGMVVRNAAQLAESGASLDEVVRWARLWADDTSIVFVLSTLEYLRKGGRVGAASAMLGKLFGVRPLLSIRDGAIVPVAKARGDADVTRKVDARLHAEVDTGERVRLGALHIGDTPLLAPTLERLKRRCRVLESVNSIPTGVIGAHVGPGCWGIVVQKVRKDDPLLALR